MKSIWLSHITLAGAAQFTSFYISFQTYVMRLSTISFGHVKTKPKLPWEKWHRVLCKAQVSAWVEAVSSLGPPIWTISCTKVEAIYICSYDRDWFIYQLINYSTRCLIFVDEPLWISFELEGFWASFKDLGSQAVTQTLQVGPMQACERHPPSLQLVFCCIQLIILTYIFWPLISSSIRTCLPAYLQPFQVATQLHQLYHRRAGYKLRCLTAYLMARSHVKLL